MDDLRPYIRTVPDFPKPGILFYDITTLLADPQGLRLTLDGLVDVLRPHAVDAVVGIESRGFLFAPHVARALGAGFVPVRKPGKLPAATVAETYQLEYGEDTLEMHADALQPGQRVAVVDDLIATGGTAAATLRLIAGRGAQVVACAFVVELTFLNGREVLTAAGAPDIQSLVAYDR
ncbi:MAG: adenine phosphoribosyltransferase [Acidobacteriota bacterium]